MAPEQLIQAHQRLLEAAQKLDLGRLLTQIPLRANPALETASWMYNRTLGLVEIHVSPQLALQLPISQLQVLLLHELMHHLGYNQCRHSFPQGAPPHLINLALDIALERALALHPPWAESLAELNNRLLLAPLPEESDPLSLEQVLPLLVHAQAPLHRLPPAAQQAWHYFWDDLHTPLTPEEIFRVLAGLLPDQHPKDPSNPGSLTWHDPHTGVTCELLPRNMPKSSSEDPSSQPSMENHSPGDPQQQCEAIQEQLERLFSREAPEVIRALHLSSLPEISSQALSNAKYLMARGTTLPRHAQWARQSVRHLFPKQLRYRVAYLPYLQRPTPGELIRRALGWPTFNYANHSPQRQETVVAVYVDVSGSMSEWLPDVMALLQCLEQHLPRRLFLFDTEIMEVQTQEALVEFPWTGGSTNFSAVFQHALENHHREALVLTDGLSEVSSELLSRCRQNGMHLNAVIFCPLDLLNYINLSYWHCWVRVDHESFTLSR